MSDKRPLSANDYDDLSAQVVRIAKTDARDTSFWSREDHASIDQLAQLAAHGAFSAESSERATHGEAMTISFDTLTDNDYERLFWRYVETLAMIRSHELKS